MREDVNIVVILSVLGLNVNNMYKVRKYRNLDNESLEKFINNFCKDNNCEVVTMCSPIEYYVIVVYKEVKDEN